MTQQLKRMPNMKLIPFLLSTTLAAVSLSAFANTAETQPVVVEENTTVLTTDTVPTTEPVEQPENAAGQPTTEAGTTEAAVEAPPVGE